MEKYRVLKNNNEYFVEAENKNEARKIILEKENIIVEKFEGFEDSIYWQRNPRYKGLKLGKSNTDMQIYGCALMCWSKAFGKDPLEVNQLFIEKGVYSNDMIIFSKACEVLGGKNYEKNDDINRMPTQKETIKEVKLGKGQHFVVRYNGSGKRWIFDPWRGTDLETNYYPFKSYRIFDK